MTVMWCDGNRLTSVTTLVSCTKSDLNYSATTITLSTMDGFCQRCIYCIIYFVLYCRYLLRQAWRSYVIVRSVILSVICSFSLEQIVKVLTDDDQTW